MSKRGGQTALEEELVDATPSRSSSTHRRGASFRQSAWGRARSSRGGDDRAEARVPYAHTSRSRRRDSAAGARHGRRHGSSSSSAASASAPLQPCERLPVPNSAGGTAEDDLSVVTYNLLADGLAQEHRRALYGRCSHAALRWSSRRARLRAQLSGSQAAFVCLQEVDHFEEVREDLQGLGYDGVFQPRQGCTRPAAPDGVALFWRRDRWRALSVERLCYRELGTHTLADTSSSGPRSGSRSPGQNPVKPTHIFFAEQDPRCTSRSSIDVCDGIDDGDDGDDGLEVPTMTERHQKAHVQEDDDDQEDQDLDDDVDQRRFERDEDNEEDEDEQEEPEETGEKQEEPKSTWRSQFVFADSPWDRGNVGLCGVFERVHIASSASASASASPSSRVCVATTHLLFNPKRGDVKLAQLCLLLQAIQRAIGDPAPHIGTVHSFHESEASLTARSLSPALPVLLCGDFNLLPDSPLYRFVSSGGLVFQRQRLDRLSLGGHHRARGTRAQVYDFDQLRSLTREQRSALLSPDREWCCVSHPLRFRSAYREMHGVEPSHTTWHLGAKETVDFIFFAHRRRIADDVEMRLRPLSTLKLPSRGGPLPNGRHGSDHYMLGASFCLDSVCE